VAGRSVLAKAALKAPDILRRLLAPYGVKVVG